MSLINVQSSSTYSGHSADVRISLIFNGHSLPVAQLGPDFLLIDQPVDHAPCDAIIVLRVDKSERSWPVRLPKGISPDSKRVVITDE